MSFLYKVQAFLKRDFRINSSYKSALFFRVGTIFSSLLTFYFISSLMGENAILLAQGYGEDYFSFVIIGVAFSQYQATAMGSGDILLEEQESGTLEAILMTPTTIGALIAAGSIYPLIETTIYTLLYLLAGIYIFDMPIGDVHVGALMLATLLSIFSFMGIGLLSTAYTLIFKRGDPFNWFFGGMSKLLGGVYFPVSVLPPWVQTVSAFLPITYSLKALRGSLLQGKGVGDLQEEFVVLFLFAIVLLPLGIFSLKAGLKKCRRDGSLVHV